MKKIVSIFCVLVICVLSLSACGMFSDEAKYVKIIDAYSKEKYSAGIESGQDTYVKIVNDTDKGVEAYVYVGGGGMFTIKAGAMEAYNNGESVLSFVKFKIESPSQTELDTEWKCVKS